MNIFGKGIDLWFDKLSVIDEKRNAAQTLTSGVTMCCDIPYIGDGKQAHLLDVYYPEETVSPMPVIFDIHGGAWVYGSKEINKAFCVYLASKGYAVVNINYTLASVGTLREQIEDIFYALAWTKKNAQNYYFDLDQLFIVGDSAGGHLALLTTVISQSEKLMKIYRLSSPEVTFRAVGSISAAHDLTMFTSPNNPFCREFAIRLFGTDYKNSPYLYCSSLKDVIRESHLPPVFSISSQEDFVKRQAVRLEMLLKKHGVDYRYRYFPKSGNHKLSHVFNVLYPEWEESITANNEMLAFFADHIN